jgi:hypothetical protein
MKRALLGLCAGVFLALPSIAAAHGSLSGGATIKKGAAGTPFRFDVIVATDGGTTHLANDRSGNCTGDGGTVQVNEGPTFTVACAHVVASSGCCLPGKPKMLFAYRTDPLADSYNVVRITDNGIPNGAGLSPDTVAFGGIGVSFATAKAWVNLGAIGSGNASTGWTFYTLFADEGFDSDYDVIVL